MATIKKPKTIQDRYTKTQIIAEIAESTELTKKQVSSVLDELTDIIDRHIQKRACGQFVLPGLLKIEAQKVPT